jgi:hypothetical protein
VKTLLATVISGPAALAGAAARRPAAMTVAAIATAPRRPRVVESMFPHSVVLVDVDRDKHTWFRF